MLQLKVTFSESQNVSNVARNQEEECWCVQFVSSNNSALFPRFQVQD